MHRFRTLVFLSALMTAPLAAAADEDAEALQKGKALYEEASALLDAKKFPEACAKLEESIKLVPIAVGARLALGECEEGRGHLGSALAAYRKAEALANAAGQPDRADLARKRAQALEPKVAAIKIQVGAQDAALEGLTIELDGRPLGEGDRSAPLPVDAGAHTVRATAKGRATFESTTTVKDADKAVVTVVFKPLGPAAAVTATPTATATGDGSAGLSPLRIGAIAAGAAGLAGLGVGAAMGGVAMSKNDESFAAGCVKGGRCTAEGTVARNAAYDAATVSTAAFIAGGVLLAAGVVLFVVAPSKAAPAKSGSPAPGSETAVLVGPGGISVRGRFP